VQALVPARHLPRAALRRAATVDLNALFQAHHGDVYRAAWRVTGNADDADDVVQTVFLRLARRSGERDGLDNPGGYLRRAAVNAALDLVRSRHRREAFPLDDAAPDPAAPVPAAMDDAALRERLRAAVATLHPRGAEIFTLRYFEGYSNRQIAALLDSTESSIGVTLFRAREHVRSLLSAGEAGATGQIDTPTRS